MCNQPFRTTSHRGRWKCDVVGPLSARLSRGTLTAMPTAPVFVLIHRRLVGALTWRPAGTCCRPVASRWWCRPWRGSSTTARLTTPSWRAGWPTSCAPKRSPQTLVLVAHSGAGALVPSVAVACDNVFEAAVLVDGILPYPSTSWFDTAPPALREPLRTLAADSWLPPWHQWFPPGIARRPAAGPGSPFVFHRRAPATARGVL